MCFKGGHNSISITANHDMKAVCCLGSSAISGCVEGQCFWFVFNIILSEEAFGEAYVFKPKR